ncbi:Oidioi.mRNA.OKI2018_I69.chr2.g7916.t1.cds [Oikopleura dioica]|uniref:Oidioi.mRNA.OKI2018_I69.chr2.g7916.t1.cds n=1 Tax=Oikopleura dioica TaxID=34765 RepID=A0ABN7T7N9_OIKDI|nr:Oidioi.mRNA.OKI2018_I69.chr2.g7916.t1.cds [Oikopleura dioica]
MMSPRDSSDHLSPDPGLQPLRPLTSAKRLRLETDDIVSSDSGASDLNLPTGGAFTDPPLPPPPPAATDTLDWWLESNEGFRDRIRRMSSESSLSIDSITREFNSASSNSHTPKQNPPSLPP